MKYAIKISGGRYAGEYDGADTIEATSQKAREDFAPFVEAHAVVKVVHFCDEGLRVYVDAIVKDSVQS